MQTFHFRMNFYLFHFILDELIDVRHLIATKVGESNAFNTVCISHKCSSKNENCMQNIMLN